MSADVEHVTCTRLVMTAVLRCHHSQRCAPSLRPSAKSPSDRPSSSSSEDDMSVSQRPSDTCCSAVLTCCQPRSTPAAGPGVGPAPYGFAGHPSSASARAASVRSAPPADAWLGRSSRAAVLAVSARSRGGVTTASETVPGSVRAARSGMNSTNQPGSARKAGVRLWDERLRKSRINGTSFTTC